MTDKDHADLAAALEEDIDWIALSFVQRPEDIVEVKEIVKGRALVMAKIEKPQAVQRIEEIMAVADASWWRVATLAGNAARAGSRDPEDLTRLARRLGKPVVVATQMLESMISRQCRRAPKCRTSRPRSSRVRTPYAVGRERFGPISARGGRDHEQDRGSGGIGEIYPRSSRRSGRARGHGRRRDRRATRDVAETLNLKVICAWTSSGSTGLRIARQRPRSSILALTPIESVARASLSSGVCIRLSPTTRATNGTWRTAPAATPISRASPGRASALSLSPACRSAPRAQPTTCASRPWRLEHAGSGPTPNEWTTPASPATRSRRRWTAVLNVPGWLECDQTITWWGMSSLLNGDVSRGDNLGSPNFYKAKTGRFMARVACGGQLTLKEFLERIWRCPSP